MKLVELLQVIAGLFGSIVSIAISIEQKFLTKLKKEGAVSEKSALKYPTRNILLRWRIKRLIKERSLFSPTENTYYFDENGYQSYRKKRRKRALIVVIMALLVLFPSLLMKIF